MKNKNFKFYIVMFVLAFGAFILSSCGGKGKLTFNESEITMGYNEELSLSNYVTLEGLSINDVTFVSSDPNIVVVTPRQTIVAGTIEGTALITAQGFSGCIEISVLGESRSFSAPTNVHFNQNTGCIEWDSVYSGNVLANNYCVKILKNGQESAEYIVNKNYYKLEENGQFDVSVACLERNGVGASLPSDVYSFHKLSAPKNLKYLSATNQFVWDADSDVSAFYVKKDGVLSDKIYEYSYTQELKDEKAYRISIVSALNVDQENVFGAESEELLLTRLKAPQLIIDNGMVSWEDTQKGVSAYSLEVLKITNDSEEEVEKINIVYNGSNYSYKLNNVGAGVYKVKITALGDSQFSGIYDNSKHYLDSKMVITENIEKLDKPTLRFDKENTQLSISNFNANKNLKYILQIKLNNTLLKEEDISSTGIFNCEFQTAGVYSYSVICKSKTNFQIDSDVSNIINVTKLGQINSVQQFVDSNGYYSISGLTLKYAQQFVIEKIFNETKTTLVAENGKYGMANEIFASEGKYQILITASGNDAENNYVLNSQTELFVQRLNKVTLTNDGQKIVWDKASDVAGILYNYELLGDKSESGSTANLYYDYGTLPAGSYKLKVKPTGGGISSNNILVLDAFAYTVLPFEIFKQIASPVIGIARDGDSYKLNINPVQNANKYLIKVNSVTLETIENTGSDTFSISLANSLTDKGVGINGQIYNIEVYAYNTENLYYSQSEISNLVIEKIAAATQFTLSEDEIVSTEKPLDCIMNYRIFINDQETNTLDKTQNLFEVKIKYISNMEKYDNKYYLDSDYAVFNLKRVPISIDIKSLLLSWSVEETSQNYVAKLLLKQNDIQSYNITITNNKEVDLSKLNLGLLGFDLNQKIEGNVSIIFDNISGNIDGEYVNGNFISGKDGELSTYFINNTSKTATIQNANSEINVNVVELNENIKITWERKESYNYSFYNGVNNFIDIENNYIEFSSENFKDSKQYIMTLTETNSTITNTYFIYINRLKPITNLLVNDDETIEVESQEGAEKPVVTKAGATFDNLQEVGTTTENIKAKYKGLGKTNNSTFYLDSEEKTYSFVRLSNNIANLTMLNEQVGNDYEFNVSWVKQNEQNYNFRLKFFDENLNSEIVVNVDYDTTGLVKINLLDEKYQNILNTLSGKKYFSIQKYVNSYIADDSEVNYLTSKYSDGNLIKILNVPSNVIVKALESDTLNQNILNIKWDIDAENVENIAKYVICIEHNGTQTFIESTGTYTTDVNSDLFKDVGEWFIKVRAVGLNDYVSSNYSNNIKVIRLKETTFLNLSKEGIISWDPVDNASGYRLVYSYINSSGEEKTDSETISQNITSSNIFVNCLSDKFDGIINLKLFALGNGTTTLTSVKETNVESLEKADYIRLEMPNVTLQNDRIVIENYLNYANDTKIFVQAKIDDKLVLNNEVEIIKDENNKYVWYLPQEFNYLSGGEVDLTTQKTINFSLMARNINAKYIDSNVTSCSMTSLSPLSNLRFVRDENGVIHFKANNNNANVTSVKLTIENYSVNLNGNIDIAITDDLLKVFNAEWKIDLQAIGKELDGINYINSKITSISGKKLKSVTSIYTEQGIVTWQEVSNATDYVLTVDENISKTGYKYRKETLSGEDFSAGEHNIVIKAVGNVTTNEQTENIILDSDNSFKYTVTKLASLSDFTVKNGYFTFTEVSANVDYKIQVFKDLDVSYYAEYPLTKNNNFPSQDGSAYYKNSNLIKELLTNNNLYIKSYIATSEDGFVNSDFALINFNGDIKDYIQVSLLNNESDITLYHPTKPDGVNLDYLVTIAKWEKNPNSSNGYILNIDGEESIISDNYFLLDENGNWTSGIHSIKYMQLGSSGLRESRLAYLTSGEYSSVEVNKLSQVNLNLSIAKNSNGINEFCFTYQSVNGANKYYSYLDDVYYKEFTNSSVNMTLFLDDIETGKVYNNFGLRAVDTSENITNIASTIKYLTLYDQETSTDKIIKLSKYSQPEKPSFVNGSFRWELTDAQWQQMLLSGQITYPFEMSFATFTKQELAVKFTTKSSPVLTYIYSDKIYNFIYMSETQYNSLLNKIEVMTSLGGYSNEDKQNAIAVLDFVYNTCNDGFASLHFGFDKFATDLPAGEYSVEVSLVAGTIYVSDDNYEAKLSSNYTKILDDYIYVAQGPAITAVAEDGKYSIEFNNINVNANYFTNSVSSYRLVGIRYDEEKEKNVEELLSTIEATAINNSEKLMFNLSDLINSKKLNGTYKQLYVTLCGNNVNILNGRLSNIINIGVLDPIQAKVEHGIIKWHTQEYASKYQIVYSEGETYYPVLNFESISDEWYEWNALELAENKAGDTKIYNVKIQACGIVSGRINTSEIFRMSGLETSIGKVIKLENISREINGVNVKNGVYTWDAVSNATSYDVYYKLGSLNSNIDGTESIINIAQNTQFETIVDNTNLYYYYFMAIGTELETLSENSLTYINSPISNYNLAKRVDNIDNIIFDNGIIKFNPLKSTNRYKLTFYKLENNGTRGIKTEIYLNNETSFDTNDYAELLAYGKYDLEIQALYENKQLIDKNSNAYYLISYVNKDKGISSTNYFKFDEITNLQVDQGRISWTFNNDGNISDKDYKFKLIFTASGKDVVEKDVQSSQIYFDEANNKYYYFEDIVYNDIETTANISLNAYVWAVENTKNNYVKSVPTEYLNIHQYQKVDESKIEISTTETSQLLVDWSKGVQGNQTQGFKYEISFSANGKEEKFFTIEPRFVTGEGNDISFNLEGDYTIILNIRVIPTIQNYISSAWTLDKEIARPKSVSGLSYDSSNCVFTWDKYQGTDNWGSYCYKIKDEVTFTKISGEVVTEVYIFTAALGDEKFEPFILGTHKLSVAVMVSNSESDNFISEYVTIENAEYNLFESGNGSAENPYIISSVEQFKNMQYRINKDAKNNEYIYGIKTNNEFVLDSAKTISTSKQYYFKQNAHLDLEKNGNKDDTLNNTNLIFDNIYDGNYYTITLNYTHIVNSQDFDKVSIFNILSANAKVYNIKLMLNLSTNSSNGKIYGDGAVARINLLCQQNNGNISNVYIGEKGSTINILTNNLILYMSFIAYENYGVITRVQNYYNISIKEDINSTSQLVQYASMVVINHNTINSVKNIGNIDIVASEIKTGGLVGQNNNGATIVAGANTGNINVYYNHQEESFVGGLVAKNNNGRLTYCYSVNTFNIQGSVGNAYIGGLIGVSEGDKISYSYVNVSYTSLPSNFNIYQLVGKLNSSNNNAENVYYKNVNAFVAVNGIQSAGIKSYDNLPTETGVNLYGTGTMFNKSDLYNGNPRLDFEASFDKVIWKD